MSVVRYSLVLKTPSVRCMLTGDRIISSQTANIRSLPNRNRENSSFLDSSRKPIASFVDGTELDEVQKEESGQRLLRTFLISS